MKATIKDELIYELLDSYGDLRSKFDFNNLDVSYPVATALKASFISCCIHNSVETQRQSWRSIRKFCLFLIFNGYQKSNVLPKSVLVEFLAWLNTKKLQQDTVVSIFNLIRTLILWCERNHSNVIAGNLINPISRGRRSYQTSKEFISVDNLKKILSVCYEQINSVDQRITQNLDNLEKNKFGKFEDEKFTLLNELLNLGNGRIPTQKVLGKTNPSLNTKAQKVGGLRHLKSMIFLTPVDLLPFYIAILIQTAGNPMAILEMDRDCLISNPIRSDRISVFWYKKRSGTEQKADFNAVKKFSAPNIIKRLIKLTINLVPFANHRHKKSLFIAYNKEGAFVPCMQMLHLLLNDFISKNSLDNFDFKNFRNTSADLHHQVSKNILIARNKLNHKSTRTTQSYIHTTYLIEEYNELIADSQEAIIATSLNNKSVSIKDNDNKDRKFSTVFGFNCNNPFEGIAPGSVKGHLCFKFFHCATCPGSIVTLDDPFVVGRLKQAELELLSAQKRSITEGWADRFNEIYLPTLKIIQNNLLSKVAPHILVKALSLRIPPIPRLE